MFMTAGGLIPADEVLGLAWFGHILSAWKVSLLPEESDSRDVKQIKAVSTSVLEDPYKVPSHLVCINLIEVSVFLLICQRYVKSSFLVLS